MDTGYKYIISDKHKFICYEIMKSCTGTLRGYFIINPMEDYGAIQTSGKSKPQIIIDKENLGYFKFAFARNPWSRLVSCWLNKFYYYRIPGNPNATGISHPDLNPNISFEEFVNFVCKIPDNIADCHFRSIHKSIPEGCYVGRAENFKDGFEYILNRLNLEIYPIERRNTTYDKKETRHWTEYYNSNLVDKVYNRYKIDIDLYGYEFG